MENVDTNKNTADLMYFDQCDREIGFENFKHTFARTISIISSIQSPKKIAIRTDRLGNTFLYEYVDGKYNIYWKPNNTSTFNILKNHITDITTSYNILNFQTTSMIEILSLNENETKNLLL